jgi:hypothetical protein
MFKTYVGKPVLVNALQYCEGLKAELLKMFPHKFNHDPGGVFGCKVGSVFVPVYEGDWITCSKAFPDRFQIFTDRQFHNQFQIPDEIEIIP